MYNHFEGVADQKRKERAAISILLASTALLGVFVWGTVKYGDFSNAYYGIYFAWFALSVYFSKAYLFFTPRRRYGTVKELKDFKETFIRSHSGAGKLQTYSGMGVIEVTLVIDFDKGYSKEYRFVYKGDLKILKAGDRVGIFRFLKMPVWGMAKA